MVLGLVFSGFGVYALRTLWKERVPLADWFARGTRPVVPSPDKESRLLIYAFCGLGASMILAALVQEFTKNKMLGGRIVLTASWLFFALVNGNAFYTGRFKWKNGPTFTREESPWAFYASAVLFALLTMSMVTYGLWDAYTSAE
jgi:hypothetical protein